MSYGKNKFVVTIVDEERGSACTHTSRSLEIAIRCAIAGAFQECTVAYLLAYTLMSELVPVAEDDDTQEKRDLVAAAEAFVLAVQRGEGNK